MPSEKEQPAEKDYSIPDEFVDYRKFIGEDISVLNVDTSSWNADDYTHELWRGSFYGHVVISRMTGYEEEDVREYLENSFEELLWEWGYFALITGK